MPDAHPDLMTVFAEALERTDPAERAAYLDGACGDDAALRRRVEALLAAHDGAGRFLEGDPAGSSEATSAEAPETIAASVAATRLPSEPATAADGSAGAAFTVTDAPRADRTGGSAVGQVIAGRYTLHEVLGEGGMGTVYRAGQTEPVKRQVALKLIKIGMVSRTVLARFDAERQALALMDHPNIARVYDGGTTEGGQPFFVMELVSGEPITEYCDRRRLPVRTRLELFVSVCQAVQHAHQKGIIHRDLKPSNVMVTEVDGRPTPKVIDFGVAKATELKLTDFSLADTGAIVGTPTYMSPEQADPASMDIDTRTDVYALGVILYELLAGSPPLEAKQFRRGAILEMLRMVREVDPPKPSTKVSTADALPSIAASRGIDPAQLGRALRGDLDWIVMMALEKDRTRRYETANGFAADILRHLAHEPVVAAPPSRAYRLRKFVRKHRGAVIAASLVLLTMLGGLAAVAAVQTVANARLAASLARETKANTDLAAANAELTRSRAAVQARYNLAVEAIKAFHTGVSEDFLLKQDQFKALRDRLLKSATEFYGRLGAMLGKETDQASRRALWQANFEVAELTSKVGKPEDALAAHRQVLAAREALAARAPADPDIRADVGRSLIAVAFLLAMSLHGEEAEATYRKAESLLVELDLTTADAAPARAVLARCRSRLGWLLIGTGREDEALALLRLARADQEAPAAAPGATAESRQDLAGTIGAVAIALQKTGKSSDEEVDAEFREELSILQKLTDDNPAVADFRIRLASRLEIRAGSLSRKGKFPEAEAEQRKALSIYQKMADDNPAVIDFRRFLANSHRNFRRFLSDMGRSSEAEAESREALAIEQKLVDDNPAVAEHRVGLAIGHNELGTALLLAGKSSEAEAESRKALAIYRELVDDNPAITNLRQRLAFGHIKHGHQLLKMGKPSEAEAEYREAVAILERLADAAPADRGIQMDLAAALLDIGWKLAQAGRAVEAIEYDKREEAIRKKIAEASSATPEDRHWLANCQNNLVDALRRSGRLEEALAACERCLAVGEPLVEAHPDWGRHRAGLGETYLRLGQVRYAMANPAGADAAWKRALTLYDGSKLMSSEETFFRACCHAGLAGLAGRPGSGISAAEGTDQAERAMAVLRQAVSMGYRNPDAYRTESALDPLRKREDFKKLAEELEKPSPARSAK